MNSCLQLHYLQGIHHSSLLEIDRQTPDSLQPTEGMQEERERQGVPKKAALIEVSLVEEWGLIYNSFCKEMV